MKELFSDIEGKVAQNENEMKLQLPWLLPGGDVWTPGAGGGTQNLRMDFLTEHNEAGFSEAEMAANWKNMKILIFEIIFYIILGNTFR